MMTLRGRIAHAATPLWQQTAACILMGGAVSIVTGGCSDASTPVVTGTQQSLVAQEAPSQPAGKILSAEIVDGKARNHTTWDLPASAFSSATLQARIEASAPSRPVEKIIPALKKDVDAAQANGTADQSIAVIVTFKDNVKVPRFPEPNMAEPRNSAGNKANEAAAQQMISTLERVRAPRYDARAKELAAKYAAREKARFWLIDAMVLELPLSAVSDVAARDDVLYVEHVKGDAPPPQYYISEGRADISSNPYSGFGGWRIGLLDTGIHPSHTLLSERYNYLRDCTSGTVDCSGGNSDDGCDHGTPVASILSGNNNLGDFYRGVTNYITIDSWKVYLADCTSDVTATVRGFQNAVAAGDKFIAVNVQVSAPDNSVISAAADAAFDAGSVVIAPAGNWGKIRDGSPVPSTVSAPGNAHKVLAVGAADTHSLLLQDFSGRGPAPDGRFKPDFTAPTNVIAASTASDTAVRWFGGTSGAMPFGAAATALAYNFLRGFNMTIDPGQVYAYMILAGRNRYSNNNEGAGLLSMPPTDGSMSYGMVTVANGQSVDITMPCWPTASVEGAIWWPETTTTHNDIDFYLIQPDGMAVDSSQMVNSVFEKVKVKTTPAPPSGLWTFRVYGYSVTGTQNVYFASLYR